MGLGRRADKPGPSWPSSRDAPQLALSHVSHAARFGLALCRHNFVL